MRSRGIEVDNLLTGNEGHSFANEETSLAIARATEMFFAKHLGGQVGTEPSAEATRALDAFHSAGKAIDCRACCGSAADTSAKIAACVYCFALLAKMAI